MKYLPIVLRNIQRNKWKSIITTGICIFVYMLLSLYFNNYNHYNSQLNELPKIAPVYCRISNLNGSFEVGLSITEKLVNQLESSANVRDAAFSVRMVGGIGDFPMEDWRKKLTLSVIGANSSRAISGISGENIHMDENVEDFFFSSNPTCIINQEAMEDNDLKVGDMVTLNLYYRYYDEEKQLQYAPLSLLPLKIIGTMDSFFTNTAELTPDILIPFEVVRSVFHQEKVDFYADSASFYVADPLQLNAFKKEMKSYILLDKVPTAELRYEGIALSVNDTTFRALASQLRQSMDALKGFFPFIVSIVIVISYITSFLLINSRQKEFALIRALGASKGKSFFLFFLEQLFLILLGEMVGILLAILLYQNIYVTLSTGVIFLFTYLLGCLTALWRMGKTSVMETLFSIE